MKRVPTALAVVGLLLGTFAGMTDAVAAEPANQLRGAAYEVEPAPNYRYVPADHAGLLTDGQIPGGRMWSSGKALGWARQSPVTMVFRLGEPTTIDRIRLHTAAGTSAEVYYPARVMVFGRSGTGGFAPLAASALARDADSPQNPRTKALELRFAPVRLTELAVLVIARGNFVFASEVEAFGRPGTGVPVEGELADIPALRAAALADYRGAVLARAERAFPGASPTQRLATPIHQPTAKEMPLAANGPGSAPPACAIVPVNPWGNLTDAASAAEGDEPQPLVALVGGRDYAAWRIENRTAAPLAVAARAAGRTDDIDTRVLGFAQVQALDASWVPDVVTPFEPFDLPGHSATTVLLETTPATTGRGTIDVDLHCGTQHRREQLDILAIEPDPEIPPLHGNLWVYLHEAPHAVAAAALSCEPDFFVKAGVDTQVVHPHPIMPDRPDADALLDRYLSAYRDAARILLFLNVHSANRHFVDLPEEEALPALRAWWDRIQQAARRNGVTGELLLYPMDEPGMDQEAALRTFRERVRKAGIEAPLYLTLAERSLGLVPLVEVAQIHEPSTIPGRIAALQGKVQLESYDTRPNGRLLSPDGYYRRQGWEALALNLTGIGVWGAWDSSGNASPDTGWSPFTGTDERDFGLLYRSPEGCAWPSRRLLAWTRGLDENRILRQCSPSASQADLASLARPALDGSDAGLKSGVVVLRAEKCADRRDSKAAQ